MKKNEYEIFWDKLSKAYPVSKGTMRLPVASELESFEHIDFDLVIEDLDAIMQKVFKKHDEAVRLVGESHHELFPEMYEGHYTGVVRFDCMFNQNNDLKLVEINTKWPDGLLLHDHTYSVLSDKSCSLHLNSFLSMFSEEEHIFILYQEHPFIDQHYLEYEKLQDAGFCVGIGNFSDLEFSGNSVYYGGKKIDIIRLSMSAGRLRGEELSLLKGASVRFFNTFDLASFGDKSLLEGIDHEMVMTTRVLDESIFFEVKENREKYVIKPTNLDEGKGVYLGVDILQDKWESLLVENLGKKYLVQEYISIQKKKVIMFDDNELKEKELYYDFCPHIFYRDGGLVGVGHVLVRYSENKVLNVLMGGGIGYHKIPY